VNRFEELGVARTASSPEIRRAYKNLVRLMHPDRCRDEALRRLAELQMQRLNETAAILLDPVRRRRYEAEIDRPAGLEALPIAVIEQAYEAGQREGNKRLATWCVLGGMVTASLFWFIRESGGPIHPQPQSGELSAQPASAESGEVSLEGRLDQLEGRLRLLELKPGDAAPSAPKATGLAGDWLYRAAISPAASPGGLAAEKRIVLKISEHAGSLRGTYSSGYEISGGALSTIMAFRFDGRPTDGQVSWTGSQGLAGDVQFRLLASDTLMASWWSYRAGKSTVDLSDATVFHRSQE